ncbi:MAG: S-layer homology domain-containing protein, partial [Oscillospiraceae bacterium]|nr:S-layer homology domain-containing protein [Oscillospiraceae bacterium]
MKKRLLAFALALVCVISLLPQAAASATVPCLTVDGSLVFIGDSNTVFLGRNNSDIQAARIYARVNATIAECVENWSRYHADGYSKGIWQLISELSGSSFRTVVINIGTNNAGTPSETFRSQYRQLLNNLYAKNPNAVIYVCKILPINPKNYSGSYTSIFTTANINRINGLVADLQAEFAAKGFDTRIMDLNTPFKNAYGVLMPEYDSGGGIHLTVKGYKRLNQIVQTILAKGDPSANHKWGPAEVRTQPSCVQAGEASYTCTVCGAVKTEAIPATDNHSWKQTGTASQPSCLEPGSAEYTCTLCGETKTESTPALGHAWTLTQVLAEAAEGESHGTALYTCSRCGETKEDKLCASLIFTDMPKEKNWAHFPIDWAYFNGITNGVTATTFAPNNSCTRGEVMTFLWRVAGKPKPTSTTNPFTDVKSGKFY